MVKLKYFYKNKYSKGKHTRNLKYYSRAERPIKDFEDIAEEITQFSSVARLCPTLCNPMTRSMPGLPVYHQLPEFTQTHVRRVSDAIQPSHPLFSPSPPAPDPSQHQSFPVSQLFT